MKIKEEHLIKEDISGTPIIDLVPERRREYIAEYQKLRVYGATLHKYTQENGTVNLDSFLLYELTEFIEEVLETSKDYVEIHQNFDKRFELAVPIEKFEYTPFKKYTSGDWHSSEVFDDPIKIEIKGGDIMKVINALYEEFLENDRLFGVLLKAEKDGTKFFWNPFHPFFILLTPEIKRNLYGMSSEAFVYSVKVEKPAETDKFKDYLKEVTLPIAAKAALTVAERRHNYDMFAETNLVPSYSSFSLSPNEVLKLYLSFEDSSNNDSGIDDLIFVPVHMMVRNGILAPAYGELLVQQKNGIFKGYNVSTQISSNISNSGDVCTGSKTSVIKNSYVLSTMNVDSPFTIQNFHQILQTVASLKQLYKELGITPNN